MTSECTSGDHSELCEYSWHNFCDLRQHFAHNRKITDFDKANLPFHIDKILL